MQPAVFRLDRGDAVAAIVQHKVHGTAFVSGSHAIRIVGLCKAPGETLGGRQFTATAPRRWGLDPIARLLIEPRAVRIVVARKAVR
ncbi:hypothetical protein MINTM002_23660 [Mycobacterium intracellulare]|nr:hypothetical protein MINTM002_23660 [Mycobacterium intracellulare]BCO67810.1 hypothetical protein MINTM007_24210 [Mycobacterium intracellulare]